MFFYFGKVFCTAEILNLLQKNYVFTRRNSSAIFADVNQVLIGDDVLLKVHAQLYKREEGPLLVLLLGNDLHMETIYYLASVSFDNPSYESISDCNAVFPPKILVWLSENNS